MTLPPAAPLPPPSLICRTYFAFSNRYSGGEKKMEREECWDIEESSGGCRHRATRDCRALIWIYDHGRWKVPHWAWGTVEKLLGPFSHFLSCFHIVCTLHFLQGQTTPDKHNSISTIQVAPPSFKCHYQLHSHSCECISDLAVLGGVFTLQSFKRTWNI